MQVQGAGLLAGGAAQPSLHFTQFCLGPGQGALEAHPVQHEQGLAGFHRIAILHPALQHPAIHLGGDEAVADRARGAVQSDLFGHRARPYRCGHHGGGGHALLGEDFRQAYQAQRQGCECKAAEGLLQRPASFC